MIQLEKVMVPTDFSDYSEPALKYGCAMAARFDSQLHLVHICPDPAMLMPEAAGLGAAGVIDQTDQWEQSAQDKLQQLPADGWEDTKEIVREVRSGSAYFEIISYAKEHDIDLIVLGTHGRSGFGHLLMGSVAENVVRKSPCPVLTVKPDGHQFVMP